MINPTARAFGEFIKHERKSKNLSQKEVGQLSGTTEAHVCRIENGLREPTLGLAIRLCESLSVDINDFVKQTKDPTE